MSLGNGVGLIITQCMSVLNMPLASLKMLSDRLILDFLSNQMSNQNHDGNPVSAMVIP